MPLVDSVVTYSQTLLAGLIALTVAVIGKPIVCQCEADGGARALLDRVRQLNETTRKWEDRSQRLDLTIVDRRGGERRRKLEMLTKKYGADASRSILFFHAPPQVRGIGFLQWVEPHQPDRQWLYLPALKRVRQITGASKQESFVGTDFSYEDLAIVSEILDWPEGDAGSSLLRDETTDGHPCAVIELVPTDPDVGYGKIRLWLSRDDLVVRRYEFEDRKGRLSKSLLVSKIEPINEIPTAQHMEMRNERSGSRTIVDFSEVRYDAGLEDNVFSQRRLEQGS